MERWFCLGELKTCLILIAELSMQNGEPRYIGPCFKKNLPVGGKLQFRLQTIRRYVLEEDVIYLRIITYGKPDKIIAVKSN